jgi:hypothetical protein
MPKATLRIVSPLPHDHSSLIQIGEAGSRQQFHDVTFEAKAKCFAAISRHKSERSSVNTALTSIFSDVVSICLLQ